MNREQYQAYADAFNSRNYDAVYDFYTDDVQLSFFGVNISSREGFKKFYNFLHSHVIETLTVLKFASSEELVALEGIIRVEGTKDLTEEALIAEGIPPHFAIKAGDVLEMPQYIHYHLTPGGKISRVGCAMM